MDQDKVKKLNELLSRIEPTDENQRKIKEIKKLINDGNLNLTLKKIDELFSENNMEENEQESDIETNLIQEDTLENNEEDTETEEDFNNTEEMVINNNDEEKETGEKYPKELENENLEYVYIGLLLNHPKYITKYYFLYDICLFENQELLNVYKSVLFFEGAEYTSELAKKGFNFSKDSADVYQYKQKIKMDVANKKYNMEKIYVDLKKLFIIRKNYLQEPMEEIQNKIADIVNYKLYSHMSVEEVENAIEQIIITKRFKSSVLNTDLTDFLKLGENNLTTGLKLPFPILNSVFKGIRKGETMAYAMPSNSGKSRFTINLAAYTAFVNKKKVLIISNEMSEEKMKLCLITTIINNPEIQKLHGQKLSKTEGEILEFKYRPDDSKNVKVDEDGFILREEGEKQKAFVKRLSEQSSEFNKVIAVTDWVNKQLNNSIYFINITDHTNEELQNVIMNYYYKEQIEYVFYDTLKTDIEHIGSAAEIKKTTTILANLAQNFGMFICSTLQLKETDTLPVNLTINDLSVSGTVKEVLDTLCLIKQIHRDSLENYEYSLNEVDTQYFELKKFKDPDVRYYACVVDKNRAGAKPTILFRLNLAYNSWEELGYLRLK